MSVRVETSEPGTARGRRVMSRYLAAVATTVLLLTACAGTEPEQIASIEDAPSTTAGGLPSSEDAALAYAKCMRDNGVVNFEDPQIKVDGSVEWPEGGKPEKAAIDETYVAAAEACKSAFAGSVADKTDLGIEKSDMMYELAVCMREHGFDMPDPDPTGGFGEFDKDSPEFAAAFEECGGVFTGDKK